MSYSPLNSTNITAALGFTPLSASTLPALTGDVTMGVNTTVTAIAANAVTNAKAAQMATNTLKGNNTGATANALDLTVAQVQTMLGAGAASGLATLDGTGKVPTAQLPSSVTGAMSYQGTWNASTNTPALVSGTGTKGFLYKVATAGTTALDGVSQWNVGDQVVFDGTTWESIRDSTLRASLRAHCMLASESRFGDRTDPDHPATRCTGATARISRRSWSRCCMCPARPSWG